MPWQTTVHLENGRTLTPEQVDTTFKQESGFLTVKRADGSFTDYPPHMVKRVRRVPPEGQ